MENSRYWDHLYLFLEISLTLLFSEYWFKMLSHLVRSWTECRCYCCYCYLQCLRGFKPLKWFLLLEVGLSYQRECFSQCSCSNISFQHPGTAATQHLSAGGRDLAPSPGKTMIACCLLLERWTGGRCSSLLPRSNLSLSILAFYHPCASSAWLPMPTCRGSCAERLPFFCSSAETLSAANRRGSCRTFPTISLGEEVLFLLPFQCNSGY